MKEKAKKYIYIAVVALAAIILVTVAIVNRNNNDKAIDNSTAIPTSETSPETSPEVSIDPDATTDSEATPTEGVANATADSSIEPEVTPSQIATADPSQPPEDSTNNISAEYTAEDLYNLAVVICREAGGEDNDEILLMVANVVINRVESPLYPNTVAEVLTQYRQYGTMWRDGISFPSWAGDNTQGRCYRLAKRILDGERLCPSNVLFQAEFTQGSGIYKKIGDFYFCYY